MNWINGFEVMCYIITAIFLVDVFKKKDWLELRLFISAALAGFALELLAVRVTDIYHYSNDYFISIGIRPYQFPFFGGLMWGGLTVYALRIARKLQMNRLKTALVSGWLIVTMDMFLDVAAIRLNGGFWVWDGRDINLVIDHHMFMSVIWVNFLGYLFETPAIVYFALVCKDNAKRIKTFWKKSLYVLLNALVGIVFVGIASLLALFMNTVTDEYFAFVAYIILWGYIFILIVSQIIRFHIRPKKYALNIPEAIYWMAMYTFCIAALVYLGIGSTYPLYIVLGVISGLCTVLLSGCDYGKE